MASPAAFLAIDADTVSEQPGSGLEARHGSHIYRLGRSDWALTEGKEGQSEDGVILSRDGHLLARFRFEDSLRADAEATIAALCRDGCAVEVLSGDHDTAVRRIADAVGLRYGAGASPADKVRRISAIERSGHKVLMVGDGLNDAPALAAATASMAPATAADIGRNAADLVFLHESLRAVPQAIRIAHNAAQLVKQNLVLAIVYNVIAVPIAIMGYLTPLLAAIAMSSSSIVVIANALRLRGSPLKTGSASTGRSS